MIGTLAGIGCRGDSADGPAVAAVLEAAARSTSTRRSRQLGVVGPDLAGRVVQGAAAAGAGRRRRRGHVVLATVWGFVGGMFGLVTILLLTFYMLVESQTHLRFLRPAVPARRRPNASPKVSELVAVKISAWLGGQMLLGLIIGTMTAIGYLLHGRAVLLRARGDRRHRRDDPDGRSAALGGSGGARRVDGVARPGARRAGFFLVAAADREHRARAEGDGRDGRPERGDRDQCRC